MHEPLGKGLSIIALQQLPEYPWAAQLSLQGLNGNKHGTSLPIDTPWGMSRKAMLGSTTELFPQLLSYI